MSEQEPDSAPEKDSTATSSVDDQRIAARAYEISLGEDAGTPEENWERVERELRDGSEANE
jgi:hypothetical protein